MKKTILLVIALLGLVVTCPAYAAERNKKPFVVPELRE